MPKLDRTQRLQSSGVYWVQLEHFVQAFACLIQTSLVQQRQGKAPKIALLLGVKSIGSRKTVPRLLQLFCVVCLSGPQVGNPASGENKSIK